jgi:hypothetical protein
MADGDQNILATQIKEVLTAVRCVHEAVEVRQAQAEQMQESLRSDLRILRQDQRELEQRLHCVAFEMQHDVTALHCDNADNRRSIDTLVKTVESLRRPITEIVLLKSRIAGLIIGLGFIGSAVLWLVEPAYRWLVETKLLRPFGG